jgi:hypothetical protein
MSEEIWKAIAGYEAQYEVSNFGRIKSLNFNRTGKERILKSVTIKSGYCQVSLCENNNCIIHSVHRLVAKAFIPNPENKPEVNHINGVKADNRVENLEWNTQSENGSHAYKTGLSKVSEKTRLAVSKNGKDSQIISTWINEKLDLEFTGNSLELVRAFPDQKLSQGALSHVRTDKYKQHKGWTIKS